MTSGATGRVLVFLHGHDDDPAAYPTLLADLLPEGFTAVVPRGPVDGPEGRAGWFDQVDGEPDPTQVGRALEVINGAIDDVTRHQGIPPRRIVLGGFSQGAAMALTWLLRADRPGGPVAPDELGGVLAIAGWLPDVDGVTIDLGRAAGVEVYVGHGEDDDVVPLPLGASVARALERRGAAVVFHRLPGGHDVTAAAATSRAWLASRDR